MSLRCPICKTVHAGVGDLDPICDGCGRIANRPTSKILHGHNGAVLLCAHCLPLLETHTLTEITDHLRPTSEGTDTHGASQGN